MHRFVRAVCPLAASAPSALGHRVLCEGSLVCHQVNAVAAVRVAVCKLGAVVSTAANAVGSAPATVGAAAGKQGEGEGNQFWPNTSLQRTRFARR